MQDLPVGASNVKYDPVNRMWVPVPESDPSAGQPAGNLNNPPNGGELGSSSDSTSTASGVSEDNVVEYLSTYITARARVLPNDLTHKPGDFNIVAGVGQQFSGLYYTQSIRMTLSPGNLTIDLAMVRANTDLVAPITPPAPQPRQDRDQITPSSSAKVHVVSPNDTLTTLATAYYGDYTKWFVIWEANKEMLLKSDARNAAKPGWYLKLGQELVIP